MSDLFNSMFAVCNASCQNGGVVDADSCTCNCPLLFTGKQCQGEHMNRTAIIFIVENAVGTVHDLFSLMLALCSENAIQHRSDAGANFAASIFSSVIYTRHSFSTAKSI